MFFLCGIFVALPFFEIPFVGLSLTAPLILPVMFYAFFRTPSPWMHLYRSWTLLAGAIWLTMVCSFVVNAPWAGQRVFNVLEVAYLVRYLFWLVLFLVTAFVASDARVMARMPTVLGVSVVFLGLLRCFEGIFFGKIGAWTNTIFTTQNNYGILFSTFTPLLFPGFLSKSLVRKILSGLGLFVVLFACAINGSRGSWICISLALLTFLGLGLFSRPSAGVKLLLPVALVGLAVAGTMIASPRVKEAVFGRFSTFEDLERDKSYMTRVVMNQRSMKMLASSPAFGVGPGRYRTIYIPLELPAVLKSKSDADFVAKSSHNSYLSYLAEGGLVGTIPLGVFLLVLAVRGAFAAMKLNRWGRYWALGIYASFIGMSVHLWSQSGLTGTHAWFVYGLLAATIFLGSRVHQLSIGTGPLKNPLGGSRRTGRPVIPGPVTP